NIRLAEFTTYKPGILVMEHTMLPRILGQNLAEMNPESCLYKFVRAMKESTTIKCAKCQLSLYRPNEGNQIGDKLGEEVDIEMGEEVAIEMGEEAAIEMGEEVAIEMGEEVAIEMGEGISEGVVTEAVDKDKKDNMCDNNEAKEIADNLNSAPPPPILDENLYFGLLCYLSCGHMICTGCAKVDGMEESIWLLKCPTCQQDIDAKETVRLIYKPLPSIVFIEGSTKVPVTDLYQAKITACHEKPLYLYISCREADWLCCPPLQEVGYDTLHP
ncbi:hypothetical protein NEHOM01_2543, partial [Nematocida homosporus]|uniref:uncharacterized protein n=1 Tax=Nematocida homosporus TaxID=1912981 RepID=UPI002220E22B